MKSEASQAALFPKGSHFFVAHKFAPLRFSETLKHGCAMRFRHDKWFAAKGGNLFQYFSDVSVLVFGKPAHLFNRVFKNLSHGPIHSTKCD